ncbi:ABC-type metal ion transporter, periplasmic subunit [Desulfobacca acetoxidans DSM 11109]|uniref:ABC-type metal ion transporter, periplasmic subunit n=1 Tax=Desulfobacca acetoxidans (strain ATCC 700848 / DSM 11109 / ASRB2) TaxID=880072 RepID=F2NBW2_DESAR|nr:ABC-type metal ion transporter, periplasmic subunit [Desulfobacca acetoxidans DSM 11109]
MRPRGVWFGCIGLLLTLGFLPVNPVLCQVAKVRVVASIVPLADFCRQIGGDRVDVEVFIPPGASPHSFEPSPGVLANLAQAKVLVYNGAGLEPWVDRFLAALGDHKPALVEAAQGIELIQEVPKQLAGLEVGETGHHQSGDYGKAKQGVRESNSQRTSHAAEVGNPHIWLDPILVQDTCRRIAAILAQVDPPHRTFYEANLNHYVAELAALHERIATRTAAFRIKEYIGFHPSFSYFARRYQLREVGVLEAAPGREPTPRALAGIVQAIKCYGIRVIFSEPQFSPRLAQAIARDTGVKVLMLDPIGGRLPYGENYLKLMQYNLETMAQAME